MSTEHLRQSFVPRVINMCCLVCAYPFIACTVLEMFRCGKGTTLTTFLIFYSFPVEVCVHVRELYRAKARLITFISPCYLIVSNLIDSPSVGYPFALDFIQ